MLHMHMTYKTMLKGTARIALSCLTLLGAMLPVACVYEQIPEAYDEADTYIHLNLNATTGLHTFTMKLPRMTGGAPLKKIDLYILANAESGSNLTTPADNCRLTRQALQEKVVSESFGLNTQGDPQCVVVPGRGLPMSRIVEDIPIEGYVTEFASPIPADLTDTRNYTDYVAYPVRRTGSIKVASIPEVESPRSLVRGSAEDAEAYMARLANAGMSSHYLTYLRETDKEVPWMP